MLNEVIKLKAKFFLKKILIFFGARFISYELIRKIITFLIKSFGLRQI